MHVLIIPSWYPTKKNQISGSFFKEQAIALQKEGHKVTIAYIDIRSLTNIVKNPFKKIAYQKEIEDGLHTYRYNIYNYIPKLNSKFNYVQTKKLDFLLSKIIYERGKPDIIHLHSFLKAGHAVRKISKKYNIPYIYTEHYSGFSRGIINKSQENTIKKIAESASKITVVGEGLKANLEEITDKDIVIVPNMVDIDNFNIQNIKKENGFIFFSLGSLLNIKGMDILLNAFSEIKNKNIKLYIGGKGEEEEKLKKLARDLKIENKVMFSGELSRKDVNKYMNICDVFVLPSRHETFGVVFIEALATGTPIIASDCEGPKGIVTYENGIIVPKENILQLTRAMEYMIKNINKYNKEKIRKDCIERFSTTSVTNKYIKIYKDILE